MRAEEEAGSEIPRLQLVWGRRLPPQAPSIQTHNRPPPNPALSPSLHAPTSGLGSLETVWEAPGAHAVKCPVAGRVVQPREVEGRRDPPLPRQPSPPPQSQQNK